MRPLQHQKKMMRRGNNGGGNSNRRGPNPLTKSHESNGPDVKVRGTASHIAEKYVSLARDAQSSGDRVMSENYLQHAEHYFRLIASHQQSQAPAPQPSSNADAPALGAEEHDDGEQRADPERRQERGRSNYGRNRFRSDRDRDQGYNSQNRGENRQSSESASSPEGQDERLSNGHSPQNPRRGRPPRRDGEQSQRSEAQAPRPEGDFEDRPRRGRSSGDQDQRDAPRFEFADSPASSPEGTPAGPAGLPDFISTPLPRKEAASKAEAPPAESASEPAAPVKRGRGRPRKVVSDTTPDQAV